MKKPGLSDATEAWEGEGGAVPAVAKPLTGTVNQTAWAEQIREKVNAEFDRVCTALESAAGSRVEQHRADTRAMLAILEEKRAEVMARDEAGYFIQEWQELRDQVRLMLANDPRYKAIKASWVAAADPIVHFRGTPR
jgi:hypothetical protein